ncbi:MAG: VacJ family lipoprotein [Magnetococcales bacterium]|nr:VacJ family lipoprotein [Magnetococcales bacterium]
MKPSISIICLLTGWLGLQPAWSVESPPRPPQPVAKAAGTGNQVILAALDDLPLEEMWGTSNVGTAATPAVRDPLEKVNRVVHEFNDVVFSYVLKPVVKGYAAVIPPGGREAVSNFFDNLAMPIHASNALAQGKGKQSAIEVGRFVINTTLGVGGIFDVAGENFHLVGKREDLGQTLGYYGVGEGIYLVLPFFGPSSARDAVGKVGDSFLDPINYVTDNFEQAAAIHAFEMANTFSFRIQEYEDLKAMSLDHYLAVRDAYIKYRREKIAQ